MSVTRLCSDVEGEPLTPPPTVICRNSRQSIGSDTSRHRHIYVLSTRQDSENVMDSIISPTVSLLNDPDVMFMMKKSFSYDNLHESPSQSPTRTDSDSSCDLLDSASEVAVCFIHLSFLR